MTHTRKMSNEAAFAAMEDAFQDTVKFLVNRPQSEMTYGFTRKAAVGSFHGLAVASFFGAKVLTKAGFYFNGQAQDLHDAGVDKEAAKAAAKAKAAAPKAA